ncbi:MAG TPA: hypothetical protein VMW95_05245 [Desulfobacterales bacterium]|nr:hypothetical protein [Desulfobacterales bacterium]
MKHAGLLLSIVCLLFFVACGQGEKAEKATVSEPEKATEMVKEQAKETTEMAKEGAGEITITGTINDTNQIVADNGTVYEVADTDMGNDLLNNVGKTVEVIGAVVEEEGVKVINVKSYKILEKTES